MPKISTSRIRCRPNSFDSLYYWQNCAALGFPHLKQCCEIRRRIFLKIHRDFDNPSAFHVPNSQIAYSAQFSQSTGRFRILYEYSKHSRVERSTGIATINNKVYLSRKSSLTPDSRSLYRFEYSLKAEYGALVILSFRCPHARQSNFTRTEVEIDWKRSFRETDSLGYEYTLEHRVSTSEKNLFSTKGGCLRYNFGDPMFLCFFRHWLRSRK